MIVNLSESGQDEYNDLQFKLTCAISRCDGKNFGEVEHAKRMRDNWVNKQLTPPGKVIGWNFSAMEH
jgi:hypothetical protein